MSLKVVCVRNVKIGEGKPKICVPIVGRTEEEIRSQAENLPGYPVDLVEWRADWGPLSGCLGNFGAVWEKRFRFCLPSGQNRRAERGSFPRRNMPD